MKIIVVMGCGLGDCDNCRPFQLNDNAIARCNKAATFSHNAAEDIIYVTSSSFSLNVPPRLDLNGFILSEASQMAKYLSGLVDSEIYCEQFSHDTLGSIFFVFYFYIKIFKPSSVVFITSVFSRERVSLILQRMLEIFSGADFDSCDFTVVSADNDDVSLERAVHENEALVKVERLLINMKSPEDVIKYFLTEHTCYSCYYSGRKVSKNDGY